jgi:hypothetical protein
VKNAKRLPELLVHASLLVTTLAVVLSVRMGIGEERATKLLTGGPDSPLKMVAATIIGPMTVLRTFFCRPIDTVLHADISAGIVIVLVFALLLFVFRQIPPAGRLTGKEILVLLLAGLLVATLPYVLMYRTYYFPPTTTIGRLSAVHAPAEFGFAVIVANLYALSQQLIRRSWIPVIVMTAFFAILAGFGMHIQQAEYVASWNQQKEFWKDILQTSGDATQGMPVVVDMTDIPQTQGFPRIWLEFGVEDALAIFTKMPKDWKRPPRVVGYADHSQEKNPPPLQSHPWNETIWSTLRNDEFIFLKLSGGHLARQNDPVTIFGRSLRPKPDEGHPPWPLGRTGKRLLEEPSSQRWSLLKDAKPYP